MIFEHLVMYIYIVRTVHRHEEEERCREVEEETNDVFLGELELATLRTSRPDHHPLEEMFNNLGVGGEDAVVEANGGGGGVKNGDVPGNHMDEIFDCRHPFGSSSQPLRNRFACKLCLFFEAFPQTLKCVGPFEKKKPFY